MSTPAANVPPSKIGWLLSAAKLDVLFELLKNTGRLDVRTTADEFVEHFTGTPMNVIFWCGTSLELVQIFKHLLAIDAVPYRRDFILNLSKHFVGADGSGINADSMRSMAPRTKKNFVEQLVKRLDEAFAKIDSDASRT